MNTPLQQAHEAAVEEEKPPVICTVAGPRQPYSGEIYSGAELRRSSPRPGAYNAFALPSLFNGKKRTPPAAAASEAVHTSGRPMPTYTPREGSIPSLVLAHLQAHGGHLTYVECSSLFGLPPSSSTAVFKKAIGVGLFVRLVVDGRTALALPGYVAPAEKPRPSKEVLARQARLERRLAQVAELQRELRELQAQAASPAAING